MPESEETRLSRILFEARERLDMSVDMVEAASGKTDRWGRRLRDEIDAYRAEKGWSPDGYGWEDRDAPAHGLQAE